jgi:hypothetical protein
MSALRSTHHQNRNMIQNGEKKVLGVVPEYRLGYRVSVVALSSWVATHCLNDWGASCALERNKTTGCSSVVPRIEVVP